MPDLGHPVTATDLLLQWRPDWLTAAVLAALVAGYVHARRAARTTSWPRWRDVLFGGGVVLTAWVTSGFPEARGHQLMWVWTSQELTLLLVVPLLLVAAQPVALARAAYGARARLPRLLASRPVRWVGHPALTLAYVPVATALLFFGGVGDLAVRSAPVGWVVHVLLLGLGAVIALPLVDDEDARTSLAVGMAVAIGFVELLVDAIPGIVLRLETHLMMPVFDIGRPPWSASWLADQQLAGAILWTVAEVLDVPFLALAFRQWLRVERRETVRIDAELDRAQAAADDGAATTTRPWWMDHPELRARFGRPD